MIKALGRLILFIAIGWFICDLFVISFLFILFIYLTWGSWGTNKSKEKIEVNN